MSEMALTIKSDKSEPLPPFIAKLWKLLQDDRFYRAPSFHKPQCNQYRSFWSIIISVSHGPLPHAGRLRRETPAQLRPIRNCARSVRDYIDWNATDDGIVVHDPYGFSTNVLPKFFKTNNIASFVRQLNVYDFRKVPHDQVRRPTCRGERKSRCRCGRGHYSFAA